MLGLSKKPEYDNVTVCLPRGQANNFLAGNKLKLCPLDANLLFYHISTRNGTFLGFTRSVKSGKPIENVQDYTGMNNLSF